LLGSDGDSGKLENRVYNKPNGCSATEALALGPDRKQQNQYTTDNGLRLGDENKLLIYMSLFSYPILHFIFVFYILYSNILPAG
jgi:hypothetical protein